MLLQRLYVIASLEYLTLEINCNSVIFFEHLQYSDLWKGALTNKKSCLHTCMHTRTVEATFYSPAKAKQQG